MKRYTYWNQERDYLLQRKRELEAYFQSVAELNNLPHSENARQLWDEYSEHGNYPFAGGYYDQPSTWREDMAYVSAEVEYAALGDDIQEANEELAALGQRK